MLSALLGWGSQYPKLRRPFTGLLRHGWRVQRATLAKAVLVIENGAGAILVLSSPGPLRLPAIDLNPWDVIATQVEAHLAALLHRSCAVYLVAVKGGPSADGVTFLYGAITDSSNQETGNVWVPPKELASSGLNGDDLQYIALHKEHFASKTKRRN